MSLDNNYGDKYFTTIANRVEINRCPSCDVGMIIDTPCDRYCPKCGYNDSSNVPLKVKLKFELMQEVTKSNIRECVVIAKEPDGTISFIKPFIDIFVAQSYIDRMKDICL